MLDVAGEYLNEYNFMCFKAILRCFQKIALSVIHLLILYYLIDVMLLLPPRDGFRTLEALHRLKQLISNSKRYFSFVSAIY